MITGNKKITCTDLFQSVNELAILNLGPEIPTPLNSRLCRNVSFDLDLRTITPEEYAEKMLNEYKVTSSARALDEQLKQKGFPTTYKFSYPYKMPPEMRKRISHDGYILAYFNEIYMHPHFPHKEKYSERFNHGLLNARRVAYWYARYIWDCNPGIYDYKNLDSVNDWSHILNFIIGASFEFHPLDIQYHKKVFDNNHHTNQAEYDKQIEFKKWCKEHGINTGCLVLSDIHIQKLRTILTKQELIM